VSEQPFIRAIRSNVVVLINPVSEPDGRDRFGRVVLPLPQRQDGLRHASPVSPPYWGRYVFHDNNRDATSARSETTRAVQRVFHEYHPVALHDLHESIALLQTWNGTGPWNPNLDPIVVSEFFDMSFAEVRDLTAAGMPGVWTWAFGEGFGHHYTESVATNHNAIGRGYETFGNASAETMARNLRDRKYVGKPLTESQWYRPSRRAHVHVVAAQQHELHADGLPRGPQLHGEQREGHAAGVLSQGLQLMAEGLNEKPYAFVIPDGQGRQAPRGANGEPAPCAENRSGARDGGHHCERGTFRGAATWCASISHTATTRWTCSCRRSSRRMLNTSRTTTFRGAAVHYGVDTKRIDDDAIRQAATEPVRDDVQPAGHVTARARCIS